MTEGNQEVTNNTLAALIALLAGFALGLIVAWIYWVQRGEEREPSESETVEVERLTLEPQPAAPEPEPAAEVEVEPDDLARVEGIGPKMSSVLAEAGIVTFDELAECDPGALKRILREEGLQFADPTTWPEQAALAAEGAWEALEDLQEELSGGRRVG
jgi:predicted flap endonuclease-1-like 5' DNA nuclease